MSPADRAAATATSHRRIWVTGTPDWVCSCGTFGANASHSAHRDAALAAARAERIR